MLRLYSMPRTRGFRVTWMLEEIGQPYEYKKVDLMKGEGHSPEYLALNPFGKVPALQDEDLVLTESAAILTYLGDKFEARELVPEPGSPARGKFDQWCYFVMAELEQGPWTISKHKFALPKEQRVAQAVETGRWEFCRAAKILEIGLGDQSFILGDQFTAADILIAQTLNWAKSAKCDLTENLSSLLDRCTARPAFKRATEREIAELKN